PSRRTIIRSIVAAALFTLAGTTVYAEPFPTRPVRILVPYAGGGAVDVLARTLGQSLSKTWGQRHVIDNRPGAGGIIASQAVRQRNLGPSRRRASQRHGQGEDPVDPLQGRRPCSHRRHIRRDSDERQSAARGGRPARRQCGTRACGDDGPALEGIV